MATVQKLKNAPISEALVDIRVQVPKEIGPEHLQAAYSKLAIDYPTVEARQRWQNAFALAGGMPVAANAPQPIVDGFRFRSPDGLDVGQYRLDGFTFSRLPLYDSWATLSTAARRCWDIYLDAVGSAPVTRLAVRYINRIEIPLPVQNLADYLVALPPIPKGIPQAVSAFLSHISVPYEQIGAVCNLTQASEPSSATSLSAIVDIDAFIQSESLSTANSEDIWRILTMLRDVKNEVFFSCISDKVIELCNR